jgi:hypothetical protein
MVAIGPCQDDVQAFLLLFNPHCAGWDENLVLLAGLWDILLAYGSHESGISS